MTKDSEFLKIDPTYRKAIIKKLRAIEAREKVKIIFAIESGSRAWGFPSPDSDYDARFIYVRDPDWYLSITPGRDVIELPIDNLLDINGWDIKKALGLLIKPNAVLLEWLSSPIRYIWDEDYCDALMTFSKQISHGSACIYHYRSVAAKQWEQHVEGRNEINLKKYFYILRPALVINWVKQYPDIIPPMNFQALLNGLNLERTLLSQIDELLDRKKTAKEMGFSPRWPEIDRYIQNQLAWAFEHAKNFKADKGENLSAANTLLRDIVNSRSQY